MAKRHLIVGGGTAGINAIRTIREEERELSEITLVSAERPYSRMVLPYYLGRFISESRVFTAGPSDLARWRVKAEIGRKAASLDPGAGVLTLDNGAVIEYDDCLIATGSRAVRPLLPGSDGPGVWSFWTLDDARAVIAGIREGIRVVIVGAGFIAFTVLDSMLALGARLAIIEAEPQILPRMIDRAGAEIVEEWLRRRGVEIRTGAALASIEERSGRRRLRFEKGEDLQADLVIMATGIAPNLEWLGGSGITINRGIVVDDRLRSSAPAIYAAGDVAEGSDLVTGERVLHAIEPTAAQHGRVAGANMAGRDVAYRGSLSMNIVEVSGLEVASFGCWDNPIAEAIAAARPERPAYRKLLFRGDRLTGALLIGRAEEIWAGNDAGLLKGLIQSGVSLGTWKAHLRRNPCDLKPAFVASRAVSCLLPQTILSRPSASPASSMQAR
jgi:NAD(P)H-nitrite reductase large subunit